MPQIVARRASSRWNCRAKTARGRLALSGFKRNSVSLATTSQQGPFGPIAAVTICTVSLAKFFKTTTALLE